MENKLFELAARRRSVRKYTNEHIDDPVKYQDLVAEAEALHG